MKQKSEIDWIRCGVCVQTTMLTSYRWLLVFMFSSRIQWTCVKISRFGWLSSCLLFDIKNERKCFDKTCTLFDGCIRQLSIRWISFSFVIYSSYFSSSSPPFYSIIILISFGSTQRYCMHEKLIHFSIGMGVCGGILFLIFAHFYRKEISFAYTFVHHNGLTIYMQNLCLRKQQHHQQQQQWKYLFIKFLFILLNHLFWNAPTAQFLLLTPNDLREHFNLFFSQSFRMWSDHTHKTSGWFFVFLVTHAILHWKRHACPINPTRSTCYFNCARCSRLQHNRSNTFYSMSMMLAFMLLFLSLLCIRLSVQIFCNFFRSRNKSMALLLLLFFWTQILFVKNRSPGWRISKWNHSNFD